MARLTYIIRRGASYYARLRVPVDLVEHYGKSELVKALGTKDEREAKTRMWPLVERWNAEFEDVRVRRTITADDKADAVWRHYSGSLDRDEERRRHLPGQVEIDAATKAMFARAQAANLDTKDPLAVLDATLEVQALQKANELDAGRRKAKLDDLRKHLPRGETALVAHEVEAYIEENRLLVAHNSDEWNDIARQMMRAEIEALERTLERDRGDYAGVPKDPIVKPATGTARERAKPGEGIMDVFEIYARENPKDIKVDTLNQARRDIGTFAETIGRTAPIHRIDKRAVRDWKALLARYPVKATETKAFAGMTMAQIVRANEQVGKPPISWKTLNRYLSSLAAFCEWLAKHGYLDANPVRGMFIEKKKGERKPTFTSDQLNELFRSPLFTGCQNPDEWHSLAKPGNVIVRDHRFWVPLIMLFSGARPGEIAQLGVADMREIHGKWIMHLTDEGEGDKSMKTGGSVRVVPVHSELIRLGFIDHHSRMKREGHGGMFPGAERNARGQMIADFSREFPRYLDRIGLAALGSKLTLYSFRHGAVDAFRLAGYLDPDFDFLIGHGKASMTERYGNVPQGALEHRVELIEAIAYPGLSLDHLAEQK